MRHTTEEPFDRGEALLARYGEDLGDDLDETAKRELLLALWQIMQAFVELGFSVRPGDKFTPGATLGMDDVLDYLILEGTLA